MQRNAASQDSSYPLWTCGVEEPLQTQNYRNIYLPLLFLHPINVRADLILFQYIAANYQFQFDAPPQAGAIYTTGFSLCSNNSLALGGSAIFYQCLSGSFYNLYDRDWA